MRVSTSKSEAMVLCRKTVECSLRVGSELLPQAKDFKYFGVLFTSEGKMEREMDRRIGAASAVMRALYWSVVVIYRSIYVPTLTYGHELWVVTGRTRSRIQVAEMTFLRRVAGLSLRDRVRSSDIQRELGVETAAPPRRKEPAEVVQASDQDASRMPLSLEFFWAHLTGRRPRGRPRTRWRDYIHVSHLAWERLGIPQEELAECCWGEGDLESPA